MNIKTLKHVLSLALIGVVSTSFAQSLSLGPAARSDLRPAVLSEAPAMPLANERRETVAFSWPATGAQAESAAPHIADSRSYQTTVSGAALAKGVSLATTAPGALIRVSSSDRGALLDLDALTVTLATGRTVSARAASDQLVSGDDLRAAGFATDPRSVGMRLADELGAGVFQLRSQAADADAQVLIEVFDRNSDVVLSVQSAAEQFFAGSRPSASVALQEAGNAMTWRSATGFVVAPDGQRYASTLARTGDSATLQVTAPLEASSGLWEWHVAVVSDSGITRHVRTAFATAYPVARFDNSVTVAQTKDALRVTLGVEASSAGRYEARATLMATDASGQLQPAMVGAVANWLESGSGVLTLEFDAAALKSQGLRSPFAVRDLRLTDQSRMGVLETRGAGVTF
ncbi:MAG: DUF4785 domain-containing protein [Gammaproteobacteria bacterium]